jgi:hypothetical protein
MTIGISESCLVTEEEKATINRENENEISLCELHDCAIPWLLMAG